jgi:subtilisin family serine protease
LVYADAITSNDNSDLQMATPTLVTDLDEYNTNEVIVTYKSDIPSDSVVNTISDTEDTTSLTDETVLIELDSKSELDNTIETLEADDDILSIQPNYSYQLLDTPNDRYYSKQWGLNNIGTFTDEDNIKSVTDVDMNIPEAWDVFSGGREITVAIVDTGIDYTHDDIKDSIWINADEVANDGIDNDKNGYIDDVHGWNFYRNTKTLYNPKTIEDDHGTHIAGIIAASQNTIGIAGVASNTNVTIMPVKALGGTSGSGSTASIIKAIAYAEANGALICNLSLGVESDDTALSNAIANSNMLFVCASGNGDEYEIGVNIDNTPMYPASYTYDNIVSVANLTCDGTLHSSSNYGVKSVDVAAPGTTIASSVVGNQYAYMTGTSMAAPMVTGVIAMVYSYYDGISILQAKNIVLGTTKSLPDLTDKVATGGLVDAYAALSLNEASILSLDTQAPTITKKVTQVSGSYKKKLKITVKDASYNLSKVRYASGVQTSSYFNSGESGKVLALSGSSITFTLSKTKTYTIYAVDLAGNEIVKTIKVTVTPPTKVVASTLKKTLKVGNSFVLKATFTPSTTISKLTFTSSNTSVATVNKTTGKVLAKKKGTATITMKTENGLTSICKITVTN